MINSDDDVKMKIRYWDERRVVGSAAAVDSSLPFEFDDPDEDPDDDPDEDPDEVVPILAVPDPPKSYPRIQHVFPASDCNFGHISVDKIPSIMASYNPLQFKVPTSRVDAVF